MGWSVLAVCFMSFMPWGETASALPHIITVEDTDALSRDAVYLGSITLVAFVVFGSALLARIGRVVKSGSTVDYIVAALVIVCSAGVVLTHILLAIKMSSTDPTYSTLAAYLAATLILLVIITAGHTWIQVRPKGKGKG